MEQNFSYYYIFNAVAKNGNISKASKELFISQPAISKAIKKLEENLGTCLFIRNSRGVYLSEEGKRLYEHTRLAFQEIEEGENELKQRNDLEIGQIRFGASTTLCRFILLPYLKEFVKDHPHIKTIIQCQPSLETVDLLEKGQLDIGLIVDTKNAKHLERQSIGAIYDTFVATKTYLKNLMEREDIDALEDMDYFDYGTIILMDKKNMTRHHIERYFSDNDIIPKQVLEVNNMDLLIEFAKAGLGIGCVVRNFVEEELTKGELVEIPLPAPIPERQICFAYIPPTGLSKSTKTFIEYISSARS